MVKKRMGARHELFHFDRPTAEKNRAKHLFLYAVFSWIFSVPIKTLGQ